MNRTGVVTASILVLFALINSQASFTSNQKKPKPKADPEREQHRAIAISSLQALAIEARSYHDEPLRARVQARVADVLWNLDQEGARALFRRAWEIAETLDQNRSSNVPGRGSTNNRTPARTNLRREILQLASRRDHKLGEEFLARLTPPDPNQTTSTDQPSSAEGSERIRLANQFLAAGNIERALQFADPALRRINSGTIQFLVALRDKNIAAADQRFASLLSIANADPASDANTVSLLTSYTFTPSVYLVVSPSGIPSSNSYEPRPAPTLTPALRRSVKDDRIRASELSEEAVAETRRIDAGSPERAYSLIALLRHFSTFSRPRMWELFSETVKAANSISDFTGENGTTSITLEGKFGIRMATELASPTDLAEAFEILAAENFYQAIDVSKTFTGDAPRAIATIAIAKTVLEEKRPRAEK